MNSYLVKKCSAPDSIDANWDRPFWNDIEPLLINVPHWQSDPSAVLPKTQAKLQYDDAHIYIIFKVQDYYVRAVATDMHGEVWKDSCVEFFFSPNTNKPNAYFNFEANCCGVMLAQHHTASRENSMFLELVDCEKITIASSASGPIRHEINKPLSWTLEYILPIDILKHYEEIDMPASGISWRGNFFKCGDDCSCPHWLSWSPIKQQQPDFHRPEYFGTLQFE